PARPSPHHQPSRQFLVSHHFVPTHFLMDTIFTNPVQFRQTWFIGRLRDFSTDDLTLGRVYEVMASVDSHGMIRVIDDSGEDYLYPDDLFEAIEVKQQTASRLHELLAA
ncbi:MAG: hypothetical protein Q8J96_11745, partial [Rhodocyclaceae bacterium]|nr:hypothetical protein [Rhodocyclaceae bacterium]